MADLSIGRVDFSTGLMPCVFHALSTIVDSPFVTTLAAGRPNRVVEIDPEWFNRCGYEWRGVGLPSRVVEGFVIASRGGREPEPCKCKASSGKKSIDITKTFAREQRAAILGCKYY